MKFLKGLISILLIASPAHAEKILDWNACVKEAAQYNPDLQTAKESFSSADYLSKGAYSNFFPQISGSLSYTDSNSSNSSTSPLIATSSSSYYSASLNASQNLFSGLQDRAKVEQAAANKDVSAASLEVAKAKLSFDLKSAFAGLLYAQDSVKLSTEIIHRREENLRLVQLRYESGGENKGSFLLSKAYLSQAKFDELQAKQNIEVFQEQMAGVLGNEFDSGIQIAGTIPTSDIQLNVDFRQIALNTPDHHQALGQQNYANAGLTLARSGFFPALNLTGSFGEVGNDFFPSDSQRWSVVVGLTIPIFNGGRDYYGTKSAMALALASSTNLSSIDKQVLVKLKQAYTSFDQAIERLKVDEDFLNAASTRAEIARNKYNNGLQTFEDWDLIENDLISREKNVLQSQRDKIIGEATWEQAQGKGVIP
jgi:outer membrane protein